MPSLPSKQDGANSSWHKITSALHFSDLATAAGGLTAAKLDSLSSLPGSVVGRRFDLNLIESRRQALELFLTRCLKHSRIGTSYALTTFLQDDKDAWCQLSQTGVILEPRLSTLSQPKKQTPIFDPTAPLPSSSESMTPDEPVKPASFTDVSDRSQELVKSLQCLADLRKQIKRRQRSLNTANKEAADALHHWCPHERLNVPLADSIQTLAHVFDSYFSLLDMVGDEEVEVDERLNGNLRYSASLMELCQRKDAVERSIFNERVKLKRFQEDIVSLENGTNPNQVPSVVGVVSSKTNTIIQNIMNVFGNSAIGEPKSSSSADSSPSHLAADSESLTKAKQLVSTRIGETTDKLVDLQLKRSDFVNSLNLECSYFEEQQQTDLLATFHTYATIQLRFADKCRRLWERAHEAMLQATAIDATTEESGTPKHSPHPPTPSPPFTASNPNTDGQFLFA